MDKFRIGRWILSLAFVVLLAGNVLAAQKVLVIPAAAEEILKHHPVANRCLEGITDAIGKTSVAFEFMYLPLYGASEADKVSICKEAVKKVNQMKPDVVILVGDDSVKYIGSLIDEIPMVFSYVYSDPASLGLPKKNISGVFARSFTPDIWGLSHQLSGGKTIAAIGRNSDAMKAVKKTISAKAPDIEKLSGVKFQDMYLCNTFEEWKAAVQSNSADMLYLTDTSNIRKDGKEMSREEITRWTVANSKVPVIAATDVDTKAGAVLAILNDERRWGEQSVEMAMKILKGTPVSNLPFEVMDKGALVINVNTAKKYEFEIPYEVLSSAREVYED